MTTDSRTTRTSGRRGLRGWLSHPGSGTPTWAFLANRVSALVLVGYLYLHLVVLSMLVRGSDSWNSFLDLAGTKAFVAVDLVLFGAVVWHAANGVRVALVGTGIAVRRQRALLVGVVVVSVLVLGAAAVALLAEG
jgi:succinate dehydrogenase / fumarate reductase cytochrome b subunit